ncbi:MAG: hypothetical protein IIA72_17395 [Proteobacteria bacterium]|nr:hypothetical protein [Pseudomonadota bacterium]
MARERFLRYLKIRNRLILQEIVDDDLRASTVHDSPRLHDLKSRRARVRQEIADKGLKSSSSGVSAWRLEMRREKIRRDRCRRYFANEKLKSSNLGLKTRRAHARQKLLEIDLDCDRLLGSGG